MCQDKSTGKLVDRIRYTISVSIPISAFSSREVAKNWAGFMESVASAVTRMSGGCRVQEVTGMWHDKKKGFVGVNKEACHVLTLTSPEDVHEQLIGLYSIAKQYHGLQDHIDWVHVEIENIQTKCFQA